MLSACDKNFPMWISVIRDVLPDCEGCPTAMAQLKVAAATVINSAPGRPQDNALSRLHYEIRQYFALAAAGHFEAWKQEKAGGKRI
jgi:hypothetical protein